MELVHKILDFEVGQVDEAGRAFWAVASTGQVDRQGDVIEAAGWDLGNFLRNPVIPWAHNYGAPPVAKALEVKVQGSDLLFRAQFPGPEEYAFADTIFKLYKGGYLRAFSVGFAPLQSEVAVHQVNGRALTGTRYLKQELYEISCVTLPANPQALAQLGLKGLDPRGLELLPRLARAASPPHPGADPRPRPEAPAPAAKAPARAALARLALGGLLESRLRYHLGLIV